MHPFGRLQRAFDVERVMIAIRGQKESGTGQQPSTTPEPVTPAERPGLSLGEGWHWDRPPAEIVGKCKTATDVLRLQVDKLGTPLPGPPNLRGWIGGVTMRVINRALWWYTYHLKKIFAASLSCHQEQAELLALLVRYSEKQIAETNRFQQSVEQDLNVLWQHVHQLQEMLADCGRQIEEKAREAAIDRQAHDLRCAELESAQIVVQSKQLDYATMSELAQANADVEELRQQLSRLERAIAGGGPVSS